MNQASASIPTDIPEFGTAIPDVPIFQVLRVIDTVRSCGSRVRLQFDCGVITIGGADKIVPSGDRWITVCRDSKFRGVYNLDRLITAEPVETAEPGDTSRLLSVLIDPATEGWFKSMMTDSGSEFITEVELAFYAEVPNAGKDPIEEISFEIPDGGNADVKYVIREMISRVKDFPEEFADVEIICYDENLAIIIDEYSTDIPRLAVRNEAGVE